MARAYLVDEDDTRYYFRDTLVDIALHDFVDLFPELVCDLCPAALHEAAHDAHDVLAALRARVGCIKIAQGNILYELFFLMDFTLWYRDVGLGLEVIRRRVRV